MTKLLESIFEIGDLDEGGGGGLESHPRLTTTVRYKSIDNNLFMQQARDILLSCAPPNFTISLASCYNYTDNYRENSLEARRHHAGRDINAKISLKRPPRNAVVDDKQVVNLHWSTCNVNYVVDKAALKPDAFMVDSKDAKRIVIGNICPVQKPGKSWKQLQYPDHDWDQSRDNAVTPMSHLFLQSNITKEESVPSPLVLEDSFIHPENASSTILHVTRTGKAVTLINLSLYEPETTSLVFNELFLLLTKPSLDRYFRNPETGRLKENFVFVVDNGPSEQPAIPHVQMWLSRLLTFLNLDSISQISFAEYHSKRNFVERVHAFENEALSREIFSSRQIYRNAEPGTQHHKENMEKMAEDVRACIAQASFNGRHIEAYRGVADDLVFHDDDRLKTFLGLSEERKGECDWQYQPLKNELTTTVSNVWNVNLDFEGSYKSDYELLCNTLVATPTAWLDKYQTTLWRHDDNWVGEAQSRTVIQPLPDYVRWLDAKELHYLTLERNKRITENQLTRCCDMPGLFLPTRLLNLFHKINNYPTDDTFRDIALLCWIPEKEVKRFFEEANLKEIKVFEQDKARDRWKDTELYKKYSLRELQDMCKKAKLSSKGLKYQLVEKLQVANDPDKIPDFYCQYKGNVGDIPASVKEISKLSQAEMKFILQYHGQSTVGNKDELVLRLKLLKEGRYHLAFYREESEIVKTIEAAEQLILEERQDYISHPQNIYRVRTHASNSETISTASVGNQVQLNTLHKVFQELRSYIRFLKQQRRDMVKEVHLLPGVTRLRSEDQIFSIGAKVKVKWDADDVRGTYWKPSWYTAYVQSADVLLDQIVVEHPTEKGYLYTLDVTPMLAEGSLKLV